MANKTLHTRANVLIKRGSLPTQTAKPVSGKDPKQASGRTWPAGSKPKRGGEK